MKKIKLTKLKELSDALHPNNIPEGTVRYGWLNEGEELPVPELRKRFYLPGSTFSTSGVQEILPDNCFKTYSSIYKLEFV